MKRKLILIKKCSWNFGSGSSLLSMKQRIKPKITKKNKKLVRSSSGFRRWGFGVVITPRSTTPWPLERSPFDITYPTISVFCWQLLKFLKLILVPLIYIFLTQLFSQKLQKKKPKKLLNCFFFKTLQCRYLIKKVILVI